MTMKKPAKARQSLQNARRYAIAISSVLLSLLTALIATMLSSITNNAFNISISYSFIAFIFFATLEMLYSQQIEKRIIQSFGRTELFRVAEIFILGFLLRLLLLFAGSEASRLPAVIGSLNEPFKAFFTPEFSTALIFLVLIWIFVLLSQQDLSLIYNLREYTDWDEVGKDQANLIQTRQRFILRFMFIGLGLLVGMIFSASQWKTSGMFSIVYHGVPPFLIITILAYFILVLLLMSQTQLARLRTRWWLNGSTLQPTLSKNWLRVSLLFFGGIAFFVLLLPTGYGEKLLQILQSVLLYLMALAQSLVALIMLPFAMLLPGFKSNSNEANEPTPEIPTPPAPQETSPAFTPPAWLDTAGDILFWVTLVMIFGFAIFQYLRQDRNLLQDLRGLFHNIIGWFAQLWQNLAQQVSDWQDEIRSYRKQAGQQSISELTVTRQHTGSATIDEPRRTIFQLYQQFLLLGSQLGKSRKVSQTPRQYETELEKDLPELQKEPLEIITDTFDQARYSKKPILQADITEAESQVRSLSRQIQEQQDKLGSPPDAAQQP